MFIRVDSLDEDPKSKVITNSVTWSMLIVPQRMANLPNAVL